MSTRWFCRSGDACARRPCSETCAEAEVDILDFVVTFVNDRNGIIDTDRPERRYPLNADAGGDTHQLVVQDGRPVRNVCSRVSPRRTDVDEGLADKAKLFRQAKQRETEVGTGRRGIPAAHRIGPGPVP